MGDDIYANWRVLKMTLLLILLIQGVVVVASVLCKAYADWHGDPPAESLMTMPWAIEIPRAAEQTLRYLALLKVRLPQDTSGDLKDRDDGRRPIM
jgi:hypothetical protein